MSADYSYSVRPDHRGDRTISNDQAYDYSDGYPEGDSSGYHYSADASPEQAHRQGGRYRQLAEGSSRGEVLKDDSLFDELDSLTEEISNGSDEMFKSSFGDVPSEMDSPVDLQSALANLESDINAQDKGDFILDETVRQSLLNKLNDLKSRYQDHSISDQELFDALADLKADFESEKGLAIEESDTWDQNIAAQGQFYKSRLKDMADQKNLSKKDLESFSDQIDSLVSDFPTSHQSKKQAEGKLDEILQAVNQKMEKRFKKRGKERKDVTEQAINALEQNAFLPQDIESLHTQASPQSSNQNSDGSNNNSNNTDNGMGTNQGIPNGNAISIDSGGFVSAQRGPLQRLVQAIITALRTDEVQEPGVPVGVSGEQIEPAPVHSKWDEVKTILTELAAESWKYIPIVVGALAKEAGGDPAATSRLLNIFPPEIRQEFANKSNDGSHLDTQLYQYFSTTDREGWITPRQSMNLLIDSISEENSQGMEYFWQDMPDNPPKISVVQDSSGLEVALAQDDEFY